MRGFANGISEISTSLPMPHVVTILKNGAATDIVNPAYDRSPLSQSGEIESVRCQICFERSNIGSLFDGVQDFGAAGEVAQ